MNREHEYLTSGGIAVTVQAQDVAPEFGLDDLPELLNTGHGVVLSSRMEYPGRYTRWDIGFAAPPLMITTRGRRLTIEALNKRGEVLIPAVRDCLAGHDAITLLEFGDRSIALEVPASTALRSEEYRSRQPSVFSALRAIIALFGHAAEPWLGLYGAFGYDLAFQFEAVVLKKQRLADARDLVLYLPDELVVVDHRREVAQRFRYEFICQGRSTRGLSRDAVRSAPLPASAPVPAGDLSNAEYADVVRQAHAYFERGDLFEVVPGRLFRRDCTDSPSAVFRRLMVRNPAPYGALLNLGAGEYLIAASPEMYVRVTGRRVESCPISGTIARGADALADADQIRTLLNSDKDAAELTMCTDVDRNDKSRVCEPGSVRVLARRQIEMYSRLIHTVDHVEGVLREDFDALDAFLAHTWAVTVTGAPKHAAMQFIEDHELSPRRWYGGAMGALLFNGDMNTGLTLRTIRLQDGVAEVRAGATLLFDSDPEAEEAETRLKASALLDVLQSPLGTASVFGDPGQRVGRGMRILMVDHQDSFVHTLAAYFRQTGAQVETLRPAPARMRIEQSPVDLVVLSPGPGRPTDFDLSATIALAVARRIPLFGVCLGLQGLVEYFGGSLGQLATPVHGKPGRIEVCGGRLFRDVPQVFLAGRYHSLYALTVPDVLEVTARTGDGVVMAVEHRELPIAAVQFHPESIMTLAGDIGRVLIHNVVALARFGLP